MTRNQKWLKELAGGKPKPKASRRRTKRGPEYVQRFAAAHEVKRARLWQKRLEIERAAEAAAKAAKKGAK